MDVDQVSNIVRQAIFVALELSAPMLILAMVVGLAISIFQSVTQINEMTLTFVPKIFVFTFVLIILFPWFLKILIKYTNDLLLHQWEKVVSLTSYVS